MGLNKRIKELEGKIVEMPKLETSKLDVSELPEAERQLYEAARRIQHRLEMTNGDYQPSEAEREIIDQSCRMLYVRAIDVFRTAMHTLFCHDDPMLKLQFDLRLTAFIEETAKRGRGNGVRRQ